MINFTKKTRRSSHVFKHTGLMLAIMAVLGSSELAQAQISQEPLFLAQQLRPNIMFTLDDSGSMDWNCVPDSLCPRAAGSPNPKSFNFRRIDNNSLEFIKYRSSSFNGLAYDPSVRYLPWQKADGTYYPDANPRNVPIADPRPAINQAKAEKMEKLHKDDIVPLNLNLIDPDHFLAYYFVLNKDGQGRPMDGSSAAHFTRIDIKPRTVFPTKHKDRSDCRGAACTYDEEIANYANWYTYYHKRILTAIAGVSQAFNPLTGNQRIGYGQINRVTAQKVDGADTGTVMMGVRDFSGADRESFYSYLLAADSDGRTGTPLRKALDDVGQYFRRVGQTGPWAEEPGRRTGIEYSCRKSYHILMTDGYWNTNKAVTPGTSNADATDSEVIENPKTGQRFQYKADSASKFYKSPAQDTLADVAMYYWYTDLRPDLINNVQTTPTNEAFWQHVTQYTVGLGVNGKLRYPEDLADLKNPAKTNVKWPDTVADGTPETVDDLWHAAVNGHGEYFSAKNPTAFRDGLRAALDRIAAQQAAASTVALNFTSSGVQGSTAYIPSFESGTWIGRLTARKVVNGRVADVLWSAESVLPAWDQRNIVTWHPTQRKAVNFLFDNLSADQKNHLGNNDVLEFLRGNAAKERAGQTGNFRDRSVKLGDIVNSSPLYVKDSNFAYQASGVPGADKYRDFMKKKLTRTPMLYVGANDGMLHAFNAENGKEAFAFVPNAVYPYLKSLSDPAYKHHYFVDGQMVEGDVYDDNKWKTLVVGSTGAGAKSLFALDVTEPTTGTAPSTVNNLKASNVLWEKSDADIPELGHVLGKPAVVRLRNGKWGIILGNGYESSGKKAVLLIVDAMNGSVIAKLNTEAGDTANPNGLSTPALLYNDKREVVTAYAGDLRGNLWRFDLEGTNASSWKVDFSGQPLFTAKDATNKVQPITLRPALGYHPQGGLMVNFATGQYFAVGDGATTQVQTAYGIWDKTGVNGVTADVVTGNRNTALQVQTLTADSAHSNIGGANLTSTTVDWQTKRGWYVDLSLGSGERGVGEPFITDDVTLWLTTLDPVSDPCESGGVSRLMGFSYLSGGATGKPLVDTNGDGVIDNRDAKISVVQTGGTVASSSVYNVPKNPPKTCPPDNPNCNCDMPGMPSCKAVGECGTNTSKVLINRMDGTTQELSVQPECRPPLRIWHELHQ